MELGDSAKVRDERSRQFQAEYDALAAVDAAWRKYFSMAIQTLKRSPISDTGFIWLG